MQAWIVGFGVVGGKTTLALDLQSVCRKTTPFLYLQRITEKNPYIFAFCFFNIVPLRFQEKAK